MATLHTQIAHPGNTAEPTVLIVDVEPRSLYELSSAFRAAGYRTLAASSFAEAKRLLFAEQPQVLVADVRLGEFNGIHLLMIAREVRPGIAAVITNAFIDSVLAEETRRLGGVFMVKPLDLRALLDVGRNRPQLWAGSNRRAADRRAAAALDFQPERRLAARRQIASVDRRSP